jgi:ATP-dependent Lhr-like helicase
MSLPPFLPFVRRWFEEAYGEPTRPQHDGWAEIAAGRHTLIVAPTGSGKTLAAFLWAIDHLHRLALDGRLDDRVHVVYVSPLRALNNDIEKNLRQPLAGIREAAARDGHELPEIRVAVRTGDTPPAVRRAMVRRPPHILITTPESLYILLTSAAFRGPLEGARFAIVDEVHALMASKRGAHLALSLERLAALASGDLQRIGCSATVRPVEAALRFLVGAEREGAIVDAGFGRPLHLEVVSPVADFLTARSETVWDAALQQLSEWIREHRTTLVFTPSRRSAERLARNLEERLPDLGVAAHHGSLSRRARLQAEDRLKRGELRALVATSSLELGIDVGSIDLVVQVQSPRTVAAALQRIGRAGHLLTRVARGKILVTKGDELVEAAAVARAIGERDLDRQAWPHAPLDVLAQQVVAAVAVEPWSVNGLLALCRRAAPFAGLELDDLRLVLGALSDPLPAEVRGARPRLLWDRVNDRLHPRRGSRLLALTSGGTIPDAGLYDVVVVDTDLKVGTLDEEWVSESLPGDVFLLGTHPWRIAKVQADRVLVEDARGMSPTVPFWKGEHPSRSYDLGALVGRLRREAAERLADPDFEAWARGACDLAPMAAAALRAWLTKGRELLGGVPDDRTVVVESFGDDMGGRHAMIHSVFGMRVNGAWGIVLRETMRQRFGLQAETSHVDDGILLSFAPGQVPPAPHRLPFLVPPEEVDALLGRGLIGSPLFTTRFRHAAVRALFIPRMQRGQRTPAWLQRLKADALMEAVGGQAEFPIVAETLRECFSDALDVPRLKNLLARLRDGEMATRHVDTPMPSPFVYPLLLAWDWAYLDAGHAEERRSDAVPMRKSWSATPGPLARDAVDAVVADLQRTSPDRRARDANELAALLEELGDLTHAEIAERARGDGDGSLGELAAEHRVVAVDFANGRRAWISTVEAPDYRAIGALVDPGELSVCPGPFGGMTADGQALQRILLRAVRTRGPFQSTELALRYDVPLADIVRVLEAFELRGLIRKLPDGSRVHVAVLEAIQQAQARARRVVRAVAGPQQFAAHVLRRQHVHPDHRLAGPSGLFRVLETLQGTDYPVRFWEESLLPARLEGYEPDWLDRLGLSGDVLWVPFELREGRVGVALRDGLSSLRQSASEPPSDDLDKAVLRHLEVRGASFPQEIASALGRDRAAVHLSLRRLFWSGAALPDTFDAIRREPQSPCAVAPRRRGVRTGAAPSPLGRWSVVPTDPVDGDRPGSRSPGRGDHQEDERVTARAWLLLWRYGVVTRELARGDWSALRHALLNMEYAGDVVRGYFVEGLSGEQYALAEALEEIEAHRRAREPHVVVSVADPANLWGPVLPLSGRDGKRISVARPFHAWLVVRAGTPVLLAEGHGRELTSLPAWDPGAASAAAAALRTVMERPAATRPVKRLEIETLDGAPIVGTDAAAAFVAAGFAIDGRRLTCDRRAALEARDGAQPPRRPADRDR